ncbi:DUF2894 domain-containing protein [Propionivibrio sp.]|uniref:DUF2894 domain-containing protein n=1 Tax=Propionivibrio sp. TaxID=2212460 RepID=UPI00272E4103|nr:DUF2894 domain-containing protein [Propionivibrio sp.]
MAEIADLQEALDGLRASGATEHAPVRFAYLEALARRAAGHPEAVREVLHARIRDAARELASRQMPPPPDPLVEEADNPLAGLLDHIRRHTGAPPATPRTAAAPELRSIARFHDTWARLSTEQQLSQTLARAPENAGPMNSQHLVLRSLQVMRDIAPGYLQGLMSYIDTLIWLEHANPGKLMPGFSAGNEREHKMQTAKRSAPNR